MDFDELLFSLHPADLRFYQQFYMHGQVLGITEDEINRRFLKVYNGKYLDKAKKFYNMLEKDGILDIRK